MVRHQLFLSSGRAVGGVSSSILSFAFFSVIFVDAFLWLQSGKLKRTINKSECKKDKELAGLKKQMYKKKMFKSIIFVFWLLQYLHKLHKFQKYYFWCWKNYIDLTNFTSQSDHLKAFLYFFIFQLLFQAVGGRFSTKKISNRKIFIKIFAQKMCQTHE